MATLISRVNGTFSSSGFYVADGSSGAVQLSRASSTTTTTSYVYSPVFTLGLGNNVDGMLLHVGRVNTTGTFTVSLNDSTTDVRTVTVNNTDLPSAQAWVFFKFSSPLSTLGTNIYKVGIKSSTSGSVTVYRSGTVNDWTRSFTISTQQNPAAADSLIVVGELTGPGLGSNFTITMDNTSANVYGSVDVGFNGLLKYSTAASTALLLTTNNTFNVWTGGTFTMGESGAAIHDTSTAELAFVNTVNVDFGLEIRAASTFTTYGKVKTPYVYLASDSGVGVGSSQLNTTPTGWKNGDLILLPSTSRTVSECETVNLTADVSSANITHTVTSFLHSGTSPTTGEIANMSRNVKIHGSSTTLESYININATAVVSLRYTEFYNMGSNTANKRGIDIATTTGSFIAESCSLRDFRVATAVGFNCNGANNNVTINNNNIYNIVGSGVILTATASTLLITNNLVVRSTASNGYSLGDVGCTFTGNIAVGCNNEGISYNEAAVAGTHSNNTAHSNGGGVADGGMKFLIALSGGTISNFTGWRNLGAGIYFSTAPMRYTTLDTATLFGNSVSGVNFNAGTLEIIMNSFTVNAGTTLTQPVGFLFGGTAIMGVKVNNSTIGTSQTHATADINIGSTNCITERCVFHNCLFGSATTLGSQTSLAGDSRIGSAKHNQTVGADRLWTRMGTLTRDSTLFRTNSPSQRLTPNNAAVKLTSTTMKVPVNSGATATVNVFIRRSVAGDGGAYNGSAPRLMMKANVAQGYTSAATALATSIAGVGAWEMLTGTISAPTDNASVEIYVDSDGTTGWVNVDDWSVS